MSSSPTESNDCLQLQNTDWIVGLQKQGKEPSVSTMYFRSLEITSLEDRYQEERRGQNHDPSLVHPQYREE